MPLLALFVPCAYITFAVTLLKYTSTPDAGGVDKVISVNVESIPVTV